MRRFDIPHYPQGFSGPRKDFHECKGEEKYRVERDEECDTRHELFPRERVNVFRRRDRSGVSIFASVVRIWVMKCVVFDV